MDPIKNPFSPGAGTPPPELAGRQNILTKADIMLKRLKIGRSEKSFLLVGLRGVGKTVLLNEIGRLAQDSGYYSIEIEACENKPLAALLIPSLRTLLPGYFNSNKNTIKYYFSKRCRLFTGDYLLHES